MSVHCYRCNRRSNSRSPVCRSPISDRIDRVLWDGRRWILVERLRWLSCTWEGLLRVRRRDLMLVLLRPFWLLMMLVICVKKKGSNCSVHCLYGVGISCRCLWLYSREVRQITPSIRKSKQERESRTSLGSPFRSILTNPQIRKDQAMVGLRRSIF